MSILKEQPNIGETLAQKLQQVGINSIEDLRASGSEDAFIKLKTVDPEGACINMLYALEGAIVGIRWHHLAESRKKELNDFYRRMNI